VRYAGRAAELGEPDMIIIPGSKSTIADLRWLREAGFETSITECCRRGIPVFGICGGYQMMGEEVSDPDGVEGGGCIKGLGLLPVSTVLAGDKKTKQFRGSFEDADGLFSGLRGMDIEGYEIHMGRTGLSVRADLSAGSASDTPLKHFSSDDTGFCRDNIYGTYVHGIFDRGEIAREIVSALAERKGVRIRDAGAMDHREFKEREYDRLADILRASLDMECIYDMLREAAI
jgi:adenosylcobyric acid synthase